MQNRKTIWLVNVNIQPPQYDTHLRHQKFAEMLIKKGYNVVIFGGSYLHHNKLNLINDSRKYITSEHEDKQYVFVKVPSYDSNGLKRMYSIFVFAWRMLYYSRKFPKPDVIVHNLHIPFDFLVYIIARRFQAKYIAEVWDLWPEAFVTTGLVKRNSIIFRFASKVERYFYRKADKIIFTMEGGKDYIIGKGWDKGKKGVDLNKCVYINNGIDVEDFNYNKTHYIIQDQDLVNTGTFKVTYLGSISLANNLQLLIDAASYLKNKKNFVFLIYGNGDDRERLITYCEKHNIENVYFKEKWVDIKFVPYILSCSSLNILNYKKNEIYKYGGSQGKLFQYLASGKPIVSNNIMGYDIVNKFGAGLSKNIDTTLDYANVINNILALDENEYQCMCKSALNASKKFDFKFLFNSYLEVIQNVCY